MFPYEIQAGLHGDHGVTFKEIHLGIIRNQNKQEAGESEQTSNISCTLFQMWKFSTLILSDAGNGGKISALFRIFVLYALTINLCPLKPWHTQPCPSLW